MLICVSETKDKKNFDEKVLSIIQSFEHIFM